RGKDPRSVYDKNQDRHTHIGVLNAQVPIAVAWSPLLNFKVKYVFDRDNRNISNPKDDYIGRMWLAFAQITVQPTNELKVFAGYEYSHWSEDGRNGSDAARYFPAPAQRPPPRARLPYALARELAPVT